MTKTIPPSQPINPYDHIEIALNVDGTLTRFRDLPRTAPSLQPTTLPILSKDLTINPTNHTWLRLFLPRVALSSNSKLPLIIFFHGSGFILTSPANTMFHDFCLLMSHTAGAAVASVEYRLAPEHRLPAAYNDAAEAMAYIRSSEDEWLARHVDRSKCFIMGNSAGGTIAYFAGLRAAEEAHELEPLKIRGLILRQPFFGGVQRSESEIRLERDAAFPLCVSDLLWELALPVGADRDHQYANLRAGAAKLDRVRELGWRVLVSVNGGDLLVDRGMELVKLLEDKGVHVVVDYDEEGSHGVEYGDPEKAKRLVETVKEFVSGA